VGLCLLGDLKPEAPDANTCAVEMTFKLGSGVDKDVWTVDDLYGHFQLGSAQFKRVETVQ